jgi:diaminopimelate decarboxylase
LINAYAAMANRTFAGLDVELAFEPGRLIVGNAGILVTRVLYLNNRPAKTFLVVDAAMNDLVRPAMYEAYHEIWPIAEPGTAARQRYDVVGPICESGDTFCTDRELPKTNPGALLAFMTAGAYGAAMSSTYNLRRLVPEVLVRGAEFAIVRPRQTYEDLIGVDRMPAWLS